MWDRPSPFVACLLLVAEQIQTRRSQRLFHFCAALSIGGNGPVILGTLHQSLDLIEYFERVQNTS
jgi:hypothetical protein